MRIYSDIEKQNIIDELKTSIHAQICFRRWSAVGHSFNAPSLRFMKGLCNDRSLAHATEGMLFIDAIANDFSRSMQCINEEAYFSGKGEQQTMLKDGSRTTSIKLKNSQAKKNIDGETQLQEIQELSNMLLWYCTDETNTHSIHLVFFQDIKPSHITSQGSARLEVRLPADICHTLAVSAKNTSIPEIPNLAEQLAAWLDDKITSHVEEQCKLLDIKEVNEDYSTPSGFLPMSVVPELPLMDSVEQESSVQPCVSTV